MFIESKYFKVKYNDSKNILYIQCKITIMYYN